MNLLEELKNLNPKTPGSWPFPVKFLAFSLMFVGVVLAGAVADWQGQWDTLGGLQQEEATLKETFLAKKKQAINLDLIKKQLTETQQSFGALLKQLPNKSEMDALLTDVNQAGMGRGLRVDLFQPGAEVTTGVFAEQPIALKVTGNYDDIGHFASDVAQLPRIVTLNDIGISTGNGGQLTLVAQAKTYRYLDETELAGQKKAAPAGAKK